MITETSILLIAVADRVLLRRNSVSIESLKQVSNDKAIRFAMEYFVKRPIYSGQLTFSLRNKKHPTAVMTRTRCLISSQKGLLSEYLTFDREKLELEAGEPLEGEWILDVQIKRACSRINPLYKIFPVSTHYTEEFYIE